MWYHTISLVLGAACLTGCNAKENQSDTKPAEKTVIESEPGSADRVIRSTRRVGDKDIYSQKPATVPSSRHSVSETSSGLYSSDSTGLPPLIVGAFTNLRERSATVLLEPTPEYGKKADALREAVSAFYSQTAATGNLTARGEEVLTAYRDEKFESVLNDLGKAETATASEVAVEEYLMVISTLEKGLADGSQGLAQ